MNIYAIIADKNGGFVLGKAKLAANVEEITTGKLISRRRSDGSIQFVSFAFAEESVVLDFFAEDDRLETTVKNHLVPIGIFGSRKRCRYMAVRLNGNDFRRFDGEMMKTDAFGNWHLFMDGLFTMGKTLGLWFADLEIAAKGGAR